MFLANLVDPLSYPTQHNSSVNKMNLTEIQSIHFWANDVACIIIFNI